ncbi:MAG: hypothetical protein KatS3mg054_1125 [Chloroflexus sp.]|nr:MAG: hypothetical protein KatS3mg054_1125 [Chloroflexus sp.]
MTHQNVSLPLAPRYMRSVHLLRDWSPQGVGIRDYQITPLVLHTAERIIAGLSPEASSRAFSLIGPYGAGKSAFGVFFASLVHMSPTGRRRLLAEHTSAWVNRICDAPMLYPVLVSGNNSSFRRAIIDAVAQLPNHLPALGDKRLKLPRVLSESAQRPDIDPQRVADLFLETSTLVAERTAFRGLVLIVDELGQFLDYAARQRDEGDVFTLQTLAETVTRTNHLPNLIITILHQAFDRYAGSAGTTRRIEWAKVQGRFIELPFQEPPAQLLRMVGAALCPTVDDPFAHIRSQWADRMAELARRLGLCPADVGADEWHTIVARAYPLHPTVLVALPLLMRQLAQNERSLFAFLTSHEPWSVQDVLTSLPFHASTGSAHRDGKTPPVYRLPHLYAYVSTTLGAGLFSRARGQRWAELAEARALLSSQDEALVDVLTTIGTLNALGQDRGLKASRAIISFALADSPDHDGIERALNELEARKHITYRHHRTSFVLWEGSDLDLDGMTREARREIGDRASLASLLQQYAPLESPVARRHSYRTGAVRCFRQRFVDAADINDRSLAPPKIGRETDGEIVFLVPIDDETLMLAERWALHADRRNEPWRIVIVPQRIQDMRDLLLDVAAFQHVLSNRPELENDRVARRELSSRLVEAQRALAAQIRDAFGWRSSRWFWRGQEVRLTTPRQIDDLLSQACDETYAATPHIWNELIVRHALSSAAAKARRTLIEAMLTHPGEELLGLQGFPPERSIYESVLRRSGLHRCGSDGTWQFAPPPDPDPLHIRPVWGAIEHFFASTEDEARPLTELYERLEAPPYGVKAGLIPLLFIAAYLANAGDVSLYEHGNYVIDPDISVFERMLRQPGYFSVRRSRVAGARIRVSQRLAQAFAPGPAAQGNAIALLEAVTPLMRIVRSLPVYARTTHRVTQSAIEVRRAILEARAPDELLFDRLPRACGFAPIPPDASPGDQEVEAFFAALRAALQELQQAYAHLVCDVGEHIRRAFGGGATDGDALRDELLRRYRAIEHVTSDPLIRTIGVRLEHAGEGNAWIESIAALVGRKPLDTWSDGDVKEFELRIADAGRRFQIAEQIAVAQRVAAPETPVMRIGIANGRGEISRVVPVIHPSPDMVRLRQELHDILQRYERLTDEQRTVVLAELMQQLIS